MTPPSAVRSMRAVVEGGGAVAHRCSFAVGVIGVDGALQVPLERIEPPGPLRSIRLQPRVELHQRLGTQPVHAPLGIASDLHQARRRAAP